MTVYEKRMQLNINKVSHSFFAILLCELRRCTETASTSSYREFVPRGQARLSCFSAIQYLMCPLGSLESFSVEVSP